MATEFHLMVQEVLERAVQTLPEERARYLREACNDNPELLAEVCSLLPHYLKMRSFQPGMPTGTAWQMPGTTAFEKAAVDAELQNAERVPPFYLDQYAILETLGRGGMGVVYRGEHIKTKKAVAIKVMRNGLFSQEDRWRFAFEVEILRHLQHPGVARIIYANSLSTACNDQPYYVMEYIRGESLTDHVKSRKLLGRQRLELLARVCEAVEYAHQRGVVHLDLKPDNILVTERDPAEGGQPKVLDFGISRVVALRSSLTPERAGRFIGTPQYASPEQGIGQTVPLTPRADVFALGLIAHELLVGQLPKRANGKLQLSISNVRLDPPSHRNLADVKLFRHYFRAILETALQRNPQRRYGSAGQLGSDLDTLLERFPEPDTRSLLSRMFGGLFGSRRQRQSRWEPSAASRPLNAVLRQRIASAMESSVTDSGDGEMFPKP